MSEKRFQVFVSSTYRDLAEERQKVAQVLQSMDCIPAGMELFPAIDEEQFDFIKRVIDDCDYYILIVAGRYGSVAADGLSYTEKEFDYAVGKGLRVIALIHENPDALPEDKRESDEELKARLRAFREKVGEGRLVKMWRTSEELPGAVAVSLQKTIKTYPAPGWIRDTGASPEKLLIEINNLRQEREQLLSELAKARAQLEVDSATLASGSDPVKVCGMMRHTSLGDKTPWSIKSTWDRLLYHLGPHLYESRQNLTVNHALARALVEVDLKRSCYEANIQDDVFFTIRAQLEALGLVTVKSLNLVKGGTGLFWNLTPKGKRRLFSLRLVGREGGHA